ncbi:peptide-binding protein [soil metagenome]
MRRINFSWIGLLFLPLLIFAGCVQPTTTQAPDVSGAIAPGGVWTRAEFSDSSNLNPILSSDAESFAVDTMLFPTLLGADPYNGAITADHAMAESWESSKDGLTWTFHLRKGVTWSDGQPVDANDFKFTYDALASEKVETPRKSNIEGIKLIQVADPLTLVVTFAEVKCDGLLKLGLPWLPRHLYKADFSDIMQSPLNEAPKLSAGPFTFQSWTRGDNTVLVRNDKYWEGAPHMDGMIYKVVPDPGARLAQLQTGEIDVVDLEPAQLNSVKDNPNISVYNFKRDGYDFIGLNLADPANPQPGQDASGKLIDQPPHPILGELAVRQAIAHSLDYKAIIDKVYLGQGYQLAANVLPAIDWAYTANLQPYTTDLALAKKTLEDAGWKLGADGVRVKDGKRLELSLLTNACNATREDLGVLVQDQLNQVGFQVKFEALDFGTVVQKLLDQTYDMVIIGWTGLGTDPNDETFWHSKFDTPGSGFNFNSYHNPKIDQLLEQGDSVVGCNPTERAPFYKQIQQIIHDDLPYIFISGNVGNTAYNAKWAGITPGPWSFYHNVHTWHEKSLQP